MLTQHHSHLIKVLLFYKGLLYSIGYIKLLTPVIMGASLSSRRHNRVSVGSIEPAENIGRKYKCITTTTNNCKLHQLYNYMTNSQRRK